MKKSRLVPLILAALLCAGGIFAWSYLTTRPDPAEVEASAQRAAKQLEINGRLREIKVKGAEALYQIDVDAAKSMARLNILNGANEQLMNTELELKLARFARERDEALSKIK